MIGAVVVALLPLFFILVNLVVKGAGSLSLDFFTRTPLPRARPAAAWCTPSSAP